MRNAHSIFILSLAVSNFCQASSGYELSAVDGGGSYSSSNTYALNGSMTTGGASSSGSYRLRSGYVGQIADVIDAQYTAADSLNEEQSTQLSAFVLYDDNSKSSLDAAEVSWGIVSGSLASIDSNGLATAGVVYEDSTAVLSGSYQSYSKTLQFTVLDTDLDNLGAYASDTLPDAWQVQYFGFPPNVNAQPYADPDGDNQNNLMEFTVGVDPTDGLSAFRVVFSRSEYGQSEIGFSPVLTDRIYNLLRKNSLADDNWIPVVGASVSDDGVKRIITDHQTRGDVQFYQIEIAKP